MYAIIYDLFHKKILSRQFDFSIFDYQSSDLTKKDFFLIEVFEEEIQALEFKDELSKFQLEKSSVLLANFLNSSLRSEFDFFKFIVGFDIKNKTFAIESKWKIFNEEPNPNWQRFNEEPNPNFFEISGFTSSSRAEIFASVLNEILIYQNRTVSLDTVKLLIDGLKKGNFEEHQLFKLFNFQFYAQISKPEKEPTFIGILTVNSMAFGVNEVIEFIIEDSEFDPLLKKEFIFEFLSTLSKSENFSISDKKGKVHHFHGMMLSGSYLTLKIIQKTE